MPPYFDYPHFPFRGFNGVGECFLRIQVLDNARLVFLCVQRPNYYGTSVTNAVESIFDAAVRMLIQKGAVPPTLLRVPFFARNKEQRRLMNVVRNSRWVEHYPPEVGFVPGGSYALVSFDDDLHPVWDYMSRAAIARECGLSEDFFHVEFTSRSDVD